MAAAAIGTSWASGSWTDTCWQTGTWAGVAVVSDDLAAGAARRRRPFLDTLIDPVEANADLVLPLFAFSAFGQVRDPIAGRLDSALPPLIWQTDGVVRDPLVARMVADLWAFQAQGAGHVLDLAGLEEQRLLTAFRSLSVRQRADVLQLIASTTRKRH